MRPESPAARSKLPCTNTGPGPVAMTVSLSRARSHRIRFATHSHTQPRPQAYHCPTNVGWAAVCRGPLLRAGEPVVVLPTG